jgi:hypothetical protein
MASKPSSSGNPYIEGARFVADVAGGIAEGRRERDEAQWNRRQQALDRARSYRALGQDDKQFGANFNLSRMGALDERATDAADAQRRLSLAPLTDRASYMLQARAGAAPQAFQARDFTKGSAPGSGAAQGGFAPSLALQATAAEQYKAGMGGVDTSALQAALSRLTSMSGVPEEYSAQTSGNAQLEDVYNSALSDFYSAKLERNRAEAHRKLVALAPQFGRTPPAYQPK